MTKEYTAILFTSYRYYPDLIQDHKSKAHTKDQTHYINNNLWD